MAGSPDGVQAPLQDVEVVGRYFAAMTAGSLDEVAALLAPELVAFPVVGRGDPVIRGREAFVARAACLHAEGLDLRIDAIETVKPHYVLATGCARHRDRAYEVFVLVQVQDGCIRMLETHGCRAQALATVGH